MHCDKGKFIVKLVRSFINASLDLFCKSFKQKIITIAGEEIPVGKNYEEQLKALIPIAKWFEAPSQPLNKTIKKSALNHFTPNSISFTTYHLLSLNT